MILRAEKISKEFIRETKGSNRFIAVQETDFTLEEGKLTVLMGRSGSGKTTVMNMLSGLLKPTKGKVMLDDTDIYSLSDKKLSILRNKHIGVIPQGQTALHSLSVIQNVCLPYTMYRDSSGDMEKSAEELLESLGIKDLRDAMPSELSGGELRRMAIARALIRKPEIILADEPTGDLDDENTEIVFDFLKKSSESGAGVLVITHENEAEKYADRVFRMNAGVMTEQFIC